MNNTETTYNYMEDFVNNIRAKGRYLFTLEEVRGSFELSEQAIKKSLKRLKDKSKIAQIRKGFYGIVTPEYASLGIIPPSLFIDDMMGALNKRYYVGLFSAAAMHGAGHQQPMEYFVVTEYPAQRDINTDHLKINFQVKKEWSKTDIISKKTDAGYLQVSTPEMTALDLLYYSSFSLNRVFTVIEELAEILKPSTLASCAKRFSQITAIQRLGYMLDEIGEEKLSEALQKVLVNMNHFNVPLNRDGLKDGPVDMRWKIIVNAELESDL